MAYNTTLSGAAMALLTAACASPPEAPGPRAGDCVRIAVTSNGWHAGLYLPAAAFDPGGEVRTRFKDAGWFAVGWGDARAYPEPLTVSRAVTAIAWPTASLVHVSAHDRDPRTLFRQKHLDVVVSEEMLERLAGILETEITGPAAHDGLYGDSAFSRPARNTMRSRRAMSGSPRHWKPLVLRQVGPRATSFQVRCCVRWSGEPNRHVRRASRTRAMRARRSRRVKQGWPRRVQNKRHRSVP